MARVRCVGECLVLLLAGSSYPGAEKTLTPCHVDHQRNYHLYRCVTDHQADHRSSSFHCHQRPRRSAVVTSFPEGVFLQWKITSYSNDDSVMILETDIPQAMCFTFLSMKNQIRLCESWNKTKTLRRDYIIILWRYSKRQKCTLSKSWLSPIWKLCLKGNSRKGVSSYREFWELFVFKLFYFGKHRTL